MSQAITPSAKCNILRITHEGHWHNGTANSLCVALFQDSTANALASLIMANFSIIIPARLLHMMLANTNISTTFKIRGGSDSAGTHTFNGFAGVQYQGGTVASYLTIEELMA